MKITQTIPKNSRFEELEVGDVFVFNDIVYMKLRDCTIDGLKRNSVELGSGRLCLFTCTLAQKVDAELIWRFIQ